MKTSVLSIMITALMLVFGFGAQADYQAASHYINAGRAERQHKSKKKHDKKKSASFHKKANREVASEKHKSKKKKKKSKKHRH